MLLEKNNLVTPEYVLHEINKYLPLIIEKSEMTKEHVEELLSILFSRITIISREQLLHHANEAKEISKEIDYYDAPYFAAALATKGVIWSNDKLLKKQNKIVVVNTQELLR